MPRIRTVKPDFFSNEEVGKLPAEARLLFIGLWTLADCEGRLQDRPTRIGAQLFPYDSWPVAALLEDLNQARLISRYEACGKKCIQIINFRKHQHPHPKETAFGLPPCPEITRQAVELNEMQVACRVDSHVLTMDYGLMESGALSPTPLSADGGGKTSERESKSRFSLKDCERYALTLKGIKAPKAYAKTIWRSGEDDEQIAAFLNPPAQKAEITKPVDIGELQALADELDRMKLGKAAAALRAGLKSQ